MYPVHTVHEVIRSVVIVYGATVHVYVPGASRWITLDSARSVDHCRGRNEVLRIEDREDHCKNKESHLHRPHVSNHGLSSILCQTIELIK